MGFTVERGGFVNIAAMMTAIINDMAGHGFTPKHVNLGDVSDPPGTMTATKATFEVSSDVDVLNGSQTWRIMVDGAVPGGHVVFGTALQLPDTGEAYQNDGTVVPAGNTAFIATIKGSFGAPFADAAAINPATPWSYRIAISDRGLVIEAWQNAPVAQRKFSWFCAQRLVDARTGEVYVAGHSPVVCLGSFNSSASVSKLVVRENDVFAPTPAEVVSANSDYIGAVINAVKQVSLAETNQYYVTFPAGFNTERHLYNEEMDLVAFTSAGVLSQFNDAVINVYGHRNIQVAGGLFANTANLPGTEVVGNVSGARAKILKLNNQGGDWVNGTGTGVLFMSMCGGEFVDGEQLKIGTPAGATLATTVIVSQEATVVTRTYKGGNANYLNDTEGMRILILVGGGGVS